MVRLLRSIKPSVRQMAPSSTKRDVSLSGFEPLGLVNKGPGSAPLLGFR